MASAPFPGLWSGTADLTGNSIFAADANGVLWMVSESTASGAAIFSSANNGITFTQAAAIPGLTGSGVAFDPAIALDASGNLHFIGQVMNGSTVSLVKYTYTVSSQTLAGPYNVTLNGAIGADYDIITRANGHCYIVSCLLTATRETILGIEMDSTGAIVSTDTLVSQAFSIGSRYGSVSLYSPDGVIVEIYLGNHPKVVTFSPLTLTILLLTRSSADVISAPTVLTRLPVMHVDNRLTLLASGTDRYISQSYYTQSKLALVGSILIGQQLSGGAWTFNTYSGTSGSSLVEPTLSLSQAGLVLAYLVKDFTQTPMMHTGPIQIRSFNNFTLSTRNDFPYGTSAQFLRGSKTALPAAMPWGFLAQSADQTARFYTGFDSPPIVTLSPNSLTGNRGTTYLFDASGSFSPNLDPLTFSWDLTDPTGEAVFVESGAQAKLMLPKSVGAEEETLAVTVTVVATKPDGTEQTPVSQTAAVTYPVVLPPVITPAAPMTVARNSTVTFTPTVTDADDDTMTFEWIQTSGTAVNVLSGSGDLTLVLSGSADLTLVFETNGALVSGEALVFQLTVSDGINASVVGSFTFNVAARQADPETAVLNRATWRGNLAQRNTPSVWSAPVATTEVTQFVTSRRGTLLGGGHVYLLVGPQSILVQAGTSDASLATYHVLLPDTTDMILDAAHSDLDATVVLTASGKLEMFPPGPSKVDTDNAAASLLLSTVTAKTYTAFEMTPSFGGVRVVVLFGTEGALMLELETTTLTVINFQELSMESGFLYGADEVVFLRMSDVESLRSGLLLIGTVDRNGNSFETQINLAARSIIATLDSSTVKNTTVTTGEILFQPNDSYAGQPLAPLMMPVAKNSPGVVLSWNQSRPDLVTKFYVYCAVNGGTSDILLVVNSGLATGVTIAGLAAGATYVFAIQAVSLDGLSPLSNSVSVTI